MTPAGPWTALTGLCAAAMGLTLPLVVLRA
jgi:hypothetical protein